MSFDCVYLNKNTKPLWIISNSRTKGQVIDDEINRYLDEQQISAKGDSINWWRDREGIYPHLLLAVHCFLCAPGSSVPSERLFSKAGELVSKKRCSLKAENVDKILFLHAN